MSVFLLFFLMIVFVGGALVARGVRGTVMFTEPRCAECGYDLRYLRFDLNDSVRSAAAHAEQAATEKTTGVEETPYKGRRCPECGADLDKKHAVQFGKSVQSPRIIKVGIAILILPLMAFAALFFERSRTILSAPPGMPSSMSTSQILVDLKKPMNQSQPWHWQELEKRWGANQLSPQEISDSVERLIDYAKLLNSRGKSPFTWADGYLAKLDNANQITPEQYGRLCEAFFGAAPTITLTQRVRPDMKLQFSEDYGSAWGMPGTQLVHAIRDVRVDGDLEKMTGVAVHPHVSNAREGDDDPDWLSQPRNFRISGEIKLPDAVVPGKHEMVFTVDAGTLIEPVTMTAVSGLPGQKQRWQGARHTWPMTVRVPFELLTADAKPVTLITEDSADPQVAMPTLTVRRQAYSQEVVIHFGGIASPPKVPVIADVEIQIGTQKVRAAFMRTPAIYGDYEAIIGIKPLAADVQSATVTLTPAMKAAERDASIDSIWGKEISFDDVPVKRNDLPVNSQPSPSTP